MKAIQLMLIVAFITSSHLTSHAQFGKLKNRLKNKIERKVERKIERKVDEKIDREIDKAIDDILDGDEDYDENETDEERAARREKRMNELSKIGFEKIELDEVYDFQFKIDWEVTAEKEEASEMSQLLSDNDNHFAMFMKDKKKKNNAGTIIFDIDKKHIVILMEEEKQAMVTSLILMEESLDDATMIQDDFKVTATGKKKQILDYTCEQYLFTSEDSNGEIWLTKDLKYSNHDFYNYMQQAARKKQKQAPTGWGKIKDGFVLESNSTSKDGKKYSMIAKAIDTNANIKIDTKGYEAMNLTGISMGGN